MKESYCRGCSLRLLRLPQSKAASRRKTNRVLRQALFMHLILAAGLLIRCAGVPETREPGALKPEVEELVNRGLASHDRGDYREAVDFYLKALEKQGDHPVILYELSFSYLYLGEPGKVLETAERGLAIAGPFGSDHLMAGLYDLKASALDDLGRGEEALEIYRAIISQYGGADSYVFYNLALTCYRRERRDEAMAALIESVTLNRYHNSSHYLLGKLCAEEERPAQSLCASLYFLLLEPQGQRAQETAGRVQAMLSSQNTSIVISGNNGFTSEDLFIRAIPLTVTQTGDGDQNGTGLFQARLGAALRGLGEMENRVPSGRTAGDELWRDFYIPFLARIANSEHFETFCRIILLSTDPGAEAWIAAGEQELTRFMDWLNAGLGQE